MLQFICYNKYIADTMFAQLHTLTRKNMSTPFTEPKLPEVTFTKNGYQIRTDILALAKDAVQVEFSSKFAGWAMTADKDNYGQLMTSESMPQVPGLEHILEAAEKMYAFVNDANRKKK